MARDEYEDDGRYAMGNDAVWTVSGLDINKNPVTYNYQYGKKMVINFSKK